ncbi:MAG TPA: YncE family protein [Candidatus Dormibacteraeota bacterium]|nr:YncE family protein [Candidatus Dormibacteraeota bacterium]
MTRRRAVLLLVRTTLLLLLSVGLAWPRAALAEWAVSSNDNKVMLDNGVVKVLPNPAPDTATIIDLAVTPPKVVAEIPVPGSVVGPPMSVAITPDQGLALITSSTKVDPADATKTIPDNRLSVVDLRATPPAVIATLEAGKGAAGVSVNRQGSLALVANRAEGTVSVFTIQGKTVAPAGLVRLGDDKSGPSHVVFTPDGKTALVTRDGDSMVSILSVDGTKVEYSKRDLSAGLRPYGIDVAADGSVAVVANIGRGNGDNDTVSVIDLRANPIRVVETVTVGQTPEGIMLSPDGKLCAVQVMNGSNKPRESPFYNANGKLLLYRVDGTRLVPLAAAWIGRWAQGIAFSADNRTILVQNMVEREIQVLRWDGTTLQDTGQRIKTNGGPAAIRTPGR